MIPRVFFFWAVGALGLLLPACTSEAVGEEARPVRLSVDVRYYYGRWQWGGFKMTPRAGMAGPDVRLELQDGRWALAAAYLSGDFAAVGATPLADPLYRSRKNFALTDNREEFEVGLEFHPLNGLGAVLAYKLVQYDLGIDVELNSDQRLYGSGQERVIDEAWGLGIGLLAQVPLRGGLAARGDLFYYPRLRAKGAGSYQYEMLYNSDRLDERWFGRTRVRGFRVRGELAYDLPGIPVSLALGYLFQLLDEDRSASPGWLAVYLAGQTQEQSWREDRFQGVTARAGFDF